MKKLIVFAILLSGSFAAMSQSYDKVQTNYVLKRYEDAKNEIDNLEKNPKAQNKPSTYVWKAKIYTALYKSDSLRAKYPDAYKAAEDAFDKSLQNYAQLKEDTADVRNISIDLYSTSFNIGLAAFREKKWDEALANFSNSVKYSDIFLPRKWTTLKQEFDTVAILYSGFAAQNAKKADIATKFYIRLIDNKVSNYSGESLTDTYKYVLIDFSDSKDSANFYRYYAIAKQAFPKEDWEAYESDFISKNYSLIERVKLYDQKNAAGSLTESQYLEFGDMFFNLHKEDKDKLDSTQIAELQTKALDAFKHAYEKNNKNAVAAFNVGIIYYTNFLALDDKSRANIKSLREINSNKPVEKDPKKKAAIDAKYKALADPYIKANQALETPTLETVNNSVEWTEKGYNILKDKKAAQALEGVEKNVYNRSVDILAVLYSYKRDKVKTKDPKAYDEYDAKFKLYDGLHSND
jgi:hypothetical protein